MKTSNWKFVCDFEDIIDASGVCALIEGRQIAIFRLGDHVYALDNHDPASGANVLSRGLLGDHRTNQIRRYALGGRS